MHKKKEQFIILIIFLWLTVLSVCLLLRVEPNIVWSGDTFIGVFVAAIGISVTFIIGYQIYNALDIKNELNSMRNENFSFRSQMQTEIKNQEINNEQFRTHIKDKISIIEKSIESTHEQIRLINASVREGIAILDALRMAEDQSDQSKDLHAFIKMHEALLYCLDYNSKNHEFILGELFEYGKSICTQSLGIDSGFAMYQDGFYYCTPNSKYYNKKLTKVLDESILPPIREIESKIRDHKNFASISFTYSDLMKRFYRRIEASSSRFFPANGREFDDF